MRLQFADQPISVHRISKANTAMQAPFEDNGPMTSDLASSHDAPAWGFIEAWLLLSIDDHGRRGCNLSQMIGTADGRNHDIPTEQATATALGRLEASGLIDSSARTFKVSKEGHKIVKRRSGEFFGQASSLLPMLTQIPCRDGLHHFEPGEFNAAYEA
jgi:hypothetical protein